MLPARTCSPPKRLTPRRLEWESRPFLVLPPAFLCAIARDSSGDDAGHLDFRIRLAMRLLAQVVLAAAELDDPDLAGLAVRLNRGRDLGPAQVGLADLEGVALADEQHLAEL